MRSALFFSYLIFAALIWLWSLFFSPAFFPIGALAGLACLYFSYREAIFFVFSLGLWLEALLPISWGSATLGLLVATVLLQLLGRHQLRSNALSKIFLGLLLQSVFALGLSMQWPPRTVGCGVLQGSEGLLSLLFAALLTPVLIWGVKYFGRSVFGADLEGRLKEL